MRRAAQLEAADEVLALARRDADAREAQLELHANELAERERTFADLERRAAEVDASAAAHDELAAELQRRETELVARATELEDHEGAARTWRLEPRKERRSGGARQDRRRPEAARSRPRSPR